MCIDMFIRNKTIFCTHGTLAESKRVLSLTAAVCAYSLVTRLELLFTRIFSSRTRTSSSFTWNQRGPETPMFSVTLWSYSQIISRFFFFCGWGWGGGDGELNFVETHCSYLLICKIFMLIWNFFMLICKFLC